MDAFQSVILGLIQGLTEFIPVSSSAHLVLVPHFLGWNIPPVTFDVVLHLGTLVAVLVYFWKDIMELFTDRRLKPAATTHSLLLTLIIACVPTFVIGVIFKDVLEGLFENPIGVSILLLVTGFLLWISPNKSSSVVSRQSSAENEKPPTTDHRLSTVSFADALWIGLAQGCAIAPGISRSGATIVTGLFRGLDGEKAVRFSFLLSIPAILGALLFKFKDFNCRLSTIDYRLYLIGGIAAAISGYFAIKIVFKTIKTGKFKYFAIYCWALGIIGLLVG